MSSAEAHTIVLVRVAINDTLFVLCAVSLSLCLYKIAKMSLANIYLESKVTFPCPAWYSALEIQYELYPLGSTGEKWLVICAAYSTLVWRCTSPHNFCFVHSDCFLVTQRRSCAWLVALWCVHELEAQHSWVVVFIGLHKCFNQIVSRFLPKVDVWLTCNSLNCAGDVSVPGDSYRSHRHPPVLLQGLLQSGRPGTLKQEY